MKSKKINNTNTVKNIGKPDSRTLTHRKDNPYNGDGEILGTIERGDELIDLTEQAEITQAGAPAECWYTAEAVSRSRVDVDGDPIKYVVTWEITDPSEEPENACDWDEFDLVEA